MTPYKIYKICQSAQGRKTFEQEENFPNNKLYGFFERLNLYFTNDLNFDDLKVSQFIQAVSYIYGDLFNPFELESQKYKEQFIAWYKLNCNETAYIKSANKYYMEIYYFCKKKKINDLNEYVKKYASQHLITHRINENVAFHLGLQNIEVTDVEKHMLKKKFYGNLKMIEERLKREKKVTLALDEAKKKVEDLLDLA